MRIIAICVILSNLLMLTGCGGSAPPPPVNQAKLPPIDDTRAPGGVPGHPAAGGPVAQQPVPQPTKTGMSTTTKVVLLAGAAALYYMYQHHKAAAAAKVGPDSQYYLSKNGRVYYRDAQHRAHYVTPPSDGIKVSEQDAQKYQQFKGYNNKQDGKDLTGTDKDE